ncbi:hypothetical protein TVAG_158010 [Trichomonas vaginalis G3]|uniref:Uncharacterized protein n=1 Tax=Trichomonas vaginalis (strain ATCC PRA-98 / G3) TaxID=412133 RepID=A2GGG5_TRIV3|nr:positive regulation of TORC1 signaling [Trichomonas vaginalis G3]EAX83751.1 hypothetical protein TVAG_158010 [Trichomonas vaginalis G3]KAI5483926.1 positive regulation of TORC1 signaling [Trichomonas vaginalis G3]|eukprot:XP_001296681.1 hypothetical protein [Trichomonas vaginalis G3]
MEVSLTSQATSIATDTYGHQVAVSTIDGKISFFSAQNLTLKSTIEIKEATPNSLSFSSNQFGSQLAVGLSNGNLLVYANKGPNYQLNYTIQAHRASITSVAFHPTQNIIATSSLDGTFAIHSFKENKWVSVTTEASKMGLTCLCWGSDSANPNAIQTVFVGGVDGTVAVYLNSTVSDSWDLGSIAQVHNGWVRSIAAPTSVSGGAQKVATIGDDNIAAVIRFTSNQLTVNYTGQLPAQSSGVSWAMVDKTLVVSQIDGKTTMWKEDQNGNLVLIQE